MVVACIVRELQGLVIHMSLRWGYVGPPVDWNAEPYAHSAPLEHRD